MTIHEQHEHRPVARWQWPPLKRALSAGVAVGGLLLVGALLLFPDTLLNSILKPRMIRACAEAYPAYSMRIGDMTYSVFTNRLTVDSVAVSTTDGTFSGTMGRLSVSGINWMRLLGGGDLTPGDVVHAELDARNVALTFPQSRYELHCARLHLSVADSEVVVDGVTVAPSGNDEQLFAGNTFRQTRQRLVIPQARVMGLACLELVRGKTLRARTVYLHDIFLDVLINKDKSVARDTPRPFMPGEILSSIPGTLQVDTLRIMNGGVKYGERFAVGAAPAVITFDSMQVVAEGITNQHDRGLAVVIHARATFMNAGTMKLRMSLPVQSPMSSYEYSGSLSSMDLRVLNAFLETAEQMRVKSGVLQAATFDISVASDRATGTTRAVYWDLTLAAINRETGSEKGFVDVIASFIAKASTIRGTNVPDKAGAMMIGTVSHARKRDEQFLECTWFALRSGVGDIVGF